MNSLLEPIRNRVRDSRSALVVLLFFFVSGACGLLYQVVWTRKLVLLFGTTAYAVSTVLSIFFIGLGAGSLWGGRLADRHPRPLLLYGLFELIIGVWAVFFVFLMGWGESGVVGILRAGALSRASGIALRALLAFAFLLLPVLLMGATLPLLAKFVSAAPGTRGLRIGALYSVNTFGAVAGCAAAGFLLLPALGYVRATWVGAAANLAIGVLATWLGGTRASVPVETSRVSEEAASDAKKTAALGLMVLAAFAISGFCALALEVLWTRLLTVVFIGTTYAFTTMLTTLLCGIAAGSAVAASFVDRWRRRVALFGAIEVLIGASCVLMLAVFAGLPERLSAAQLEAGYRWEGLVRAKFLLSFMVLFAPTFLFGMTFPIVVKTITSTGERLGRDIGRLYAANTFGGVLGAIAGGFVLIPLLGTHRGIVTLAVTLVVVGAVLIAVSREIPAGTKAGAIALAAVLLGVSLYIAPKDVSFSLNDGYIPKDHRLLHFCEGLEGTVAVSEPQENPGGSNRVLWINAVQATASIEKGVKMNRFQGVLPLLFDRDPQTALFMCLGSGITAGTLGLYDYERIDAVEISRDVLEAAAWFAADNFNVLANPRIHFVVEDGRNFLLTARETYDVITFEPMPLALAGVSTFYTREYYRLCLQHLRPGGLVSQWIPLHSLDPEVVRALMATFARVFPVSCAWFVNADLFMAGSNQPLHIDYARLKRRLAAPTIERALHEAGFRDLPEIINCFFMGQGGIDAFTQGAEIMTDDRPWAEFAAPKLMYQRTVDKTLEAITPFFESPATLLVVPEGAEGQQALEAIERRHAAKASALLGLKEYYGGTFGSQPEAFFKKALEIDPNDAGSQYYLKEITLARAATFTRWDEADKAIEALESALAYAPDLAELHLALADIVYDRHDVEKARVHYGHYVALGGTAPRAKERL